MINVKKGTAHSMQQSDAIGLNKVSEAVLAGMLVNLNSSGEVIKGVTSQGVDNKLGFAVNSYTDGDVLESGKIGLYNLDGNSIIETDQVTIVTGTVINVTDYPIGSRVAGDTTTGKIKIWASGDRVVGYVDSLRTLPSTASISQNYKNVAGSTLTKTITTQTGVILLGIKLAV